MSLGLLIAVSLALGVAAWLFFVWTVKSGQYDDPEGAKYRMLEDDEGERKQAAQPGAAERDPARPASDEPHRGPERSP